MRALLPTAAAVAAFACLGMANQASAETPPFNPIGEQETLVIPVRIRVPDKWDGKECANAKDASDLAKWQKAAAAYEATPRFTAAEVAQRLEVSTDVNFFYRQSSYGKTFFDFVPLVNPGRDDGWWTAPRSQPQYCKLGVDDFGAPGAFMYDVVTSIYQGAIDRKIVTQAQAERYHRILAVLDVGKRGGRTAGRVFYNIAPGGSGTPTQSKEFSAAFVDQDANDEGFFNVARHELGHTLRLSAHYYTGCSKFKPATDECLGPWDPMGWDWYRTEFSSYTRVEAGWIPDVPDYLVNLPQLVVSGEKPALTREIALAPLEAAFTGNAGFATGKPLAARIPIGSTLPFKGLYLECRQQIGFDTQTMSAVKPTFIRGIPAYQGGILISYVDTTRDNPRIYVERPNALKDLSIATVAPGDAFLLDAYARHLEVANVGSNGRCVASISQSYTGNYTGYNVGFRATEASSAGFVLPPNKSSTDIWIDSDKNGFGHFDLGQDVTNSGHVKVPSAGGDAPSAGRKSRIWFRLHNEGDTSARRVRVKVMASQSPVGESCPKAMRTVGTVRVGSMSPGRDAIRSIPWTPRGSEARGQVLLRARGGRGEVDLADNAALMRFDPLGGRANHKQRIALPAAFGCRNPTGLRMLVVPSPGWRIPTSPSIRPRTRFVSGRAFAPPSAPTRPSTLLFVKNRVEGSSYPAEPGETAMPFHDIHQETIGATTLFRRFLTRSSIGFACAPEGTVGSNIEVTGRVSEASAGSLVALSYTSPTGKVSTQRRATGSRGRFADAFLPDRPGVWRAQARWFGDAEHLPSVSERCAFTVTPR
jgi:hypothetical protein